MGMPSSGYSTQRAENALSAAGGAIAVLPDRPLRVVRSPSGCTHGKADLLEQGRCSAAASQLRKTTGCISHPAGSCAQRGAADRNRIV
jgi:hypothetical protein